MTVRLHAVGEKRKFTNADRAFLRELERIAGLADMRVRELEAALSREDVDLGIRAARGLLAVGLIAGSTARQFRPQAFTYLDNER